MIICDNEKAKILKSDRDIDINEIIDLIIDKKYLDTLENTKREGQQIFILSYKKLYTCRPFYY